MKMKRLSKIFFISCSLCLLCCIGCASKQVKVALNYKPVGAGFLSDLKPTTVSLQVIDYRPGEKRNIIGVQRSTSFGEENATVVSSIPEIQVVYDALEAELKRSGHQVLNPEQGSGEIIINVRLTQFFIDSKAVEVNIELVSSIQADVIASASSRNVPQISFTVDSTYRDFVPIGLMRPAFFGLYGMMSSSTRKNDIEKNLNGALVEFVRRFCLEPKLRKVFL